MNKNTLITKITRPIIKGILPRKRLFRLLDSGRDRPITWVAGPAGAGKTTLVASWLDARKLPCLWYQVDEGDADISTFFYYIGLAAKKAALGKRTPLPLLTPEYQTGIPIFTRRYFEELFSRLKHPFVIVFDDYQEVNNKSDFHEIVRNGLSVIPKGINVILISRAEPPRIMAHLRAGNKMRILEWEDLKLTPDESKGIMKLRSKDKLPKGTIEIIHKKTDGWAAGLVLMAESAKMKNANYKLPDKQTPEEIFDYFATELFEKTDKDTQDFLLKTAFLPEMTAQMAESLTGFNHAGRVLYELQRSHCFTQSNEKHVYRYHQLFREFLLSSARRTFTRDALSKIQRTAALLLEKSGRVEDAAKLLRNSGDWEGYYIQLVLNHAQFLFAQGRIETLQKWVNAIPENILESTPWLLYWKGVCRLPFDPRESQDCFERAFQRFELVKDTTGMFLSWAGIVEAIEFAFENMYQLDQWIDRLTDLIASYGEFPSVEIEARAAAAMFNALVLRQPLHPDFDYWRQKAVAVKDVNSKINALFHLAFHYGSRGYIAESHMVLEKLHNLAGSADISPFSLIKIKLLDHIAYALSGSSEYTTRATQEALGIAERTGVHILDSMLLGNHAMTELNDHDLKSARIAIDKMTSMYELSRPWDRSRYHNIVGSEAYINGDMKKARMHAELSVQYADQVGFAVSRVWCRYLNAVVLHGLGEHENADKLLEEGYSIGLGAGSIMSRYEYCVTKAQFSLVRKDEKELLFYLREAMAIGKKQGILGTYILWQPSIMALLSAIALENGIEVDYVRELITKRNLVPPDESISLGNWPWPVKIYTLGKFELLINEKPVGFSGKVQKKPLEMLKAIIAFGGKEVSELKIVDALWPDADGDSAHSAFTTTLSRLRKLLGDDKFLRFQEGKTTLDPHYCYVDVWAFERLLNEIDNKWKVDRDTDKIIHLFEKAVALYKGQFLPEDSERLWTISARERLRNKFLRLITGLGHYHEQKGQWKKALECYWKGLEVDDLAEELYQDIMTCHHRLGRRAEAIRAYKQLKEILSAELGVEPSPETEAIYLSIKQS